jgi:hypothetical protein
MITGKHPARSPETDGDLIGNEMDVVPGAQIAEFTEIAGRIYLHPRRALDKGFDDDTADFIVMGQE